MSKSNYSASINIIRDKDIEYIYYPTVNSKAIVSSIDANFGLGKHSFVIIGSYGTGKSALLWAIEQSLAKKNKYFEFTNISNKKVNVLNVVGSYQSITDAFSELLNVNNRLKGNQLVLDKVHQLYEEVGRGGLLVIQIDEMGKFLEYASGHNAKADLYFLQQLAEMANNPNENILLIATLHQNFESYAFGLSELDRNEWTKIKGRFEILAFNEPVEQLLHLAAAELGHKKEIPKSQKQILQSINSIALGQKLFTVGGDTLIELSEKLYPMDSLSAHFLTLALQKYGQNERSLFGFLHSKEMHVIQKDGSLFDIVELHDYLWSNYHSVLISRGNPHLNTWNDISSAIDWLDFSDSKNREDLICLVKVLGMFQLFSAKGTSINEKVLGKYLHATRGIDAVESLLEELKSMGIVIYSNYNKSYKIIQGTDLDIEGEIEKASGRIGSIENVADALLKLIGQLQPLLAKRVSFNTGTPRLFNYVVSEDAIHSHSAMFDGSINLLVNSNEVTQVKEVSAKSPCVLYAVFNNSEQIKHELKEIEKVDEAIRENNSDKVAQREMNGILLHHKALLRHYFLDGVFGKDVKWFYRGEQVVIDGRRALNCMISSIAEEVYEKAPSFKNELINRTKVSTAISTARNELFKRVVNYSAEKNLGFDENYPPEKTIYLTLLKEQGIHRQADGGYTWGSPHKKSPFLKIWEAADEFLKESCSERKPVSELFDRLASAPYGLKQGLIETLVPIYLYIHRDDFALFGDDGYIPELNESFMQLFIRNRKEYEVKAFNVKGVNLDIFNKYRELLQQTPSSEVSNAKFIESIRPFLVFYKQLPEYAKLTKRLPKEVISLREAITKAEDPEKAFFEDFPRALGTTVKELHLNPDLLQDYTFRLREAIRVLRTSFDELLNRFEEALIHELGVKNRDFLLYKQELIARYSKIKSHFLLPHQKTFLQRVSTKLDDRNSWLSSVAQALVGRSLETLKDDDEPVLFDKLKSILHELDNLLEIHKIGFDEKKERVYRFEVTSEQLYEKQLVRIPKTKFKEADQLELNLRMKLDKDKMLNIAVLTKLLQEQIKK